MTLRAKVLSGLRWTATARLASQLVSWAITLVVIRILSPSDYGLVAMAMVVIALGMIFAQLGIGAALVQLPDVDDDLLRKAFGAVLVVNLSVAACLFLVAPIAGAFYDEPRMIPMLRALALQFVFSALAVIPDVQVQRRMDFRSRSVVDLVSAILNSLVTLGLALAGAGAWALIIGTLAGQLCNAIGLNWLSPFLHFPRFSLGRVRPLLRSGAQLILVNVFGTLYSQADIFICAKWLGNEIVGFYSVAMHVAAMPVHRLSTVVNQVAFPAFASIQHDLRDVAGKLLLGIRLLSFLTVPVMWGLSSIAPEFIEVLFGPKWALSIVPLQVLTLVMPVRMIGSFTAAAISGLGRYDILLQNAIWALAVGAPLFFAGAYWGGLTGLSLAWLLMPPLISLPFLMRSAPVIGLRVGQIVMATLPSAAAGLTMYCAVIAARHVLGEGQAVLRMCILVAVGALTYCGASFGVNRKGTLEALGMIRSVAAPGRG